MPLILHTPQAGCTLMIKGSCDRCHSSGWIKVSEEEYQTIMKQEKEVDWVAVIKGLAAIIVAVIGILGFILAFITAKDAFTRCLAGVLFLGMIASLPKLFKS